MGQPQLKDLIYVSLLLGIAALLTLVFEPSPVVSWILYYVPASLFLLLKGPKKNLRKILFGSFIAGIIFGTAIDLMGTYNQLWSLDILVFPVKIFGVLPLDDLFWWFLSMFFIFTLYEHFIKERVDDTAQVDWKLNKKLKASLVIGILLILVIGFGIIQNATFVLDDGLYLKIGALLFILLLIFLIKYPKKTGIFFLWSIPVFFLNLIMEIIAVRQGQWSFPDVYIGTIKLLGATFPVEEFVFWMILSTPVIFAWYDRFVDLPSKERF